MAKETRNITGVSKAYSNKKSKNNKYSNSQEFSARTRRKKGGNKERFLYNKYR